MIWFFALLCCLLAFVIAAVAVGSVTARQAARLRPAVFDLDEAVEYVADSLPPDLTARVSYDDVRTVLTWHIEYLADKGLASYRTDAEEADGLVLVDDDEVVAHLLARLDGTDLELSDSDIVEILRAQSGYYRKIGAIGAEAGS